MLIILLLFSICILMLYIANTNFPPGLQVSNGFHQATGTAPTGHMDHWAVPVSTWLAIVD